MEGLDIKTITEAGSVGIAVLLILYSAWKDKMYNKSQNNHQAHLTEVITRLDKSIVSLDKTMQSQTKVLENNGRIMERVERVLDKG